MSTTAPTKKVAASSDATMRQIAHEVGYDSEFAFARAFKRATGSAPGQYRKLTQASG